MAFMDVGSRAYDRGSPVSAGTTTMVFEDKATETGTLTSLQIYAETTMNGTNKIATFHRDSLNGFTVKSITTSPPTLSATS